MTEELSEEMTGETSLGQESRAGDSDFTSGDETDFAAGADAGRRYGSVEEALAACPEEGGGHEDDEAIGDDEDEAADDDSASGDDDAASISLGDGEDVSLGELKRGYLRQQDYTRKTQDLARSREAVEAVHDAYADRAASLQNAYETLARHLEGLLPPEPDPSLARIDPERYRQDAQLREAAVAELQALQQAGDAFGTEFGEAVAEEGARYREREEASLVEALPFLGDPARRAAFDAANRETALAFGFAEDEIARTADHRILQLVHYARIGRHAEQTGRDVARQFAGTPRRGRRGQPATGERAGPSAAMRRFLETGALEDAMKVDFID